MLTYSARKNSANFSDEYSVWNPPTSSDSASARSNGARLVSPTIRDREHHEAHRQQPDEPAGLLRGDDVRGGERPGVEHHTPMIERPSASS